MTPAGQKQRKASGYSKANRRRINKLQDKILDLNTEVKELSRSVTRIQAWLGALYDVDAATGPNTRPKTVKPGNGVNWEKHPDQTEL